MVNIDHTAIPNGEAGNDLEPIVEPRAEQEEPETWVTGANSAPIETPAPDWNDQQLPVTDDPFDDGWTDEP